jgi:hypothetical protein
MHDPDWGSFINDLSRAFLFQKVDGLAGDFQRKYRREIISLLTMLEAVDLFGSPTSDHPDPPTNCDLCGRSLTDYRWFADCEHGARGEWGNLCQSCFIAHGGSLGWGRGQLYMQTGDGQWRHVVGADPDC